MDRAIGPIVRGQIFESWEILKYNVPMETKKKVGRPLTPWDDRYLIDSGTGCWNWVMAQSHGYGQLQIKGKYYGAHRAAWERVNGEIPEGGVIRHTCDNPICVNPDHLRLGTQLDNIRDMDNKSRCSGRGHATAKPRLKAKQVQEIRFRLGVLEDTLISVARDFQMSRMQIRRIRDRQAWAHID